MKALTIIQPWATLIALGEKKIETRSWRTKYRGPVLIHAGKKEEKWVYSKEPFKSVLDGKAAPTGAIIAKAVLIDCIKVVDWKIDTSLRVVSATLENGQVITGNELEFGDYVPGRFASILGNVEMLKEPIPAKGQLGLWEFDYKE